MLNHTSRQPDAYQVMAFGMQHVCHSVCHNDADCQKGVAHLEAEWASSRCDRSPRADLPSRPARWCSDGGLMPESTLPLELPSWRIDWPTARCRAADDLQMPLNTSLSRPEAQLQYFSCPCPRLAMVLVLPVTIVCNGV